MPQEPHAPKDELERLRERIAELERRCAMYEAVCEALPDPVLITDADRRIVLENRRAAALFRLGEGEGEERERAVGLNNYLFSSFLARQPRGDTSPRDLALVDPATEADLRVEALSVPLPPDLGRPDLTVSLLRDVTELKRASNELEHQYRKARQAEAASRQERDRLDLILENAGAPIVVTDEEGRVVLMNRAAERLFRRDPEAAPDSPAGLAVADNEARFAQALSGLAEGDEPRRATKLQLADPGTGEGFPAEAVSARLLDEEGRTAGVVSVLHDESREVENARLAAELARLNEGLEERIREATRELAARNEQLEWQRRELERAYRLKSEFLASMSHELRTPINALLGYTSLMQDRIWGELTPKQAEALERMRGASEHLLDLVSDILDLAKIEAGKMPVHLEPVELADLFREVSLTIEPMVEKKGLEYVVDVAEDLPVLETDRTRVKQVVLNLLSNAVKFTHVGSVRLRARRADDAEAVEVEVADTGIGIREEDLEAIFDDFRQVDQSSTREYGGTGLGLSIVRKLLGLLGGSIRVRSAAGRGSVFTVRLPLRSAPVQPGEEAIRAAAEGTVEIERRPLTPGAGAA